MADKTIDQLEAAALSDFSEATEYETQVMDLGAPQSRKQTEPQARFLHLDLTKLALVTAVADPTAALMLVVDPGLADDAATRNVRAIAVAHALNQGGTRNVTFTGPARPGAGAGWTLPADNTGVMAHLPHNVASATLIIPLPGLRVGDTIENFYLTGSIKATGSGFTSNILAAELHSIVPTAGVLTDTVVNAFGGAVSVAVDTLMDASAYASSGSAHVVADGETLYLYIDATNGNGAGVLPTIDLLGVVLQITPA